jgi:hypothetical protein
MWIPDDRLSLLCRSIASWLRSCNCFVFEDRGGCQITTLGRWRWTRFLFEELFGERVFWELRSVLFTTPWEEGKVAALGGWS